MTPISLKRAVARESVRRRAKHRNSDAAQEKPTVPVTGPIVSEGVVMPLEQALRLLGAPATVLTPKQN
jgi:hypothetical protein